MKVALSTSHGRMAPCFAGIDLWIVADHPTAKSDRGKNASGQGGRRQTDVLSTHGWHPLAWGRELMRRDVTCLLCAGIDQGTWAAIRGHGIQVVPHAGGNPDAVFDAWRSGKLNAPPVWPAYPPEYAGHPAGGPWDRRRQRGRFRGGRGKGWNRMGGNPFS